MNLKATMTLGIVVLAVSVVPAAMAQCGMPNKAIKPAAWHPQEGAARLVRTADDDDRFRREDGKSIVGMWHVVFTADTMGGAKIPATVIDNALAVWHTDHTEIMNSVRPPQDGNFCLGVWEQTDRSKYFLNHFPWYANEFPNSTNNGIGDPQGPTQIQEWVTLDRDGDSFTGKFTLVAYKLDNSVLASFTGTLSGTRVTVKTTEKELVGN